MKKSGSTTNLFGFNIYSKDYNSLLYFLFSHLEKSNRLLSIFTPNPEQIVLAKRDKTFGLCLGFADILIPDGIGLVFASKFLAFFKKSDAVTQRITGIDLSKRLLRVAKKKKLKVLVIGGRDYLGIKYDSWKVDTYPGNESSDRFELNKKCRLCDKEQENIIWWAEGFNKIQNPTVGENKTIISTISTLKPDIIFVALGAPYQEEWVKNNYEILENSKVSIIMVVGGTFDVLFGKVSRSPKWMIRLGLEWFYRLIKQPWRWRRQLKLLDRKSVV